MPSSDSDPSVLPAENPLLVGRAIRQQLESWQAAGITLLPRVVLPDVVAAATSPVSELPAPTRPLASPGSVPDEARSVSLPFQSSPVTDESMPRAKPAASKTLVPEPPVAVEEDAPTGPLSREQRVDRLQKLAAKVAQCRRCTLLAETRTQTVFGVGNPEAKILFVGEAPGADEDRQGEPFVGRAGKLLNDIISACRMKREEIYICNILKCRPPENRTPQPDECANCREFLLGQLQTINPAYIVCWGAVAAQNVLGSPLSIGKLRGKFHTFGQAKVLCTYHPSYLLRNPPAKKDVWEDMKFLFLDMGIDLAKQE